MKKTKPLNQVCSIGAYAPNRTSKLLNKSENDDSILGRLIEFASSVPDFVPICIYSTAVSLKNGSLRVTLPRVNQKR